MCPRPVGFGGGEHGDEERETCRDMGWALLAPIWFVLSPTAAPAQRTCTQAVCGVCLHLLLLRVIVSHHIAVNTKRVERWGLGGEEGGDGMKGRERKRLAFGLGGARSKGWDRGC